MTSALLFAAVLTLAAGPEVDVATLDGSTVKGELRSVAGTTLVLGVPDGERTVALDQVLTVGFPSPTPSPPPAPAKSVRVLFADGGWLACRDVGRTQRRATLTLPDGQTVELPLASIRAIRFQPDDAAIDEKWKELVEKPTPKDLLVVRNADVLDRLEGSVGKIEPQTLTFFVGDSEVPIPRDKPKLFGLVFSSAEKSPVVVQCTARLLGGDRLPLTAVAISEQSLRATLAGGGTLTLPLAAVASLDFGGGKVTPLASLEPKQQEHTPFFDGSVFAVHRNRNDEGEPIRLAGQSFATGLVIHSKTRIVYRLSGDYRRFVATAGIEETVAGLDEQGLPRADLELTISADGRELLRRRVTGIDEPFPLDLDVTGARELTILVDFGENLDISDHLALGDARLIK